jgi:hypothetical protein
MTDHLDDRLLHRRASLALGRATPGIRGMIVRRVGGFAPLMTFSAEGCRFPFRMWAIPGVMATRSAHFPFSR